MATLEDAVAVLTGLRVPQKQRTDLCGYTLLALLGLGPDTDWSESSGDWIRIHDVIRHMEEYYGRTYAENTRENVRKKAMHPFRDAAIIEDNGKPTNSPKYSYRATPEFLTLVRTYGTDGWEDALKDFLERNGSLIETYGSKKKRNRVPIRINGRTASFSPGEHNGLQKAIMEEFAPRFAPGCTCIYIGDTEDKDLFKDTEELEKLRISITDHDKLPDIILHDDARDWIFFIEAVTSVGPISPKRIIELRCIAEGSDSGLVFVTAFPDMRTFKKFASELAWETEVWIADVPDHMIHLNGDRFLGPRSEERGVR